MSLNVCQSPGRHSPICQVDIIVDECLPVPGQTLTCLPGGYYPWLMSASHGAGSLLSARRIILSMNVCQPPGRPSPVCQADIIVGECLPVLDQALTVWQAESIVDEYRLVLGHVLTCSARRILLSVNVCQSPGRLS